MQFSEDAVIVDANGGVTQTNGDSGKMTAVSHSKPPEDNAADGEVDEVAEMFKGLGKKKKTKKPKDDAENATAEGEFDPSALKKKVRVPRRG